MNYRNVQRRAWSACLVPALAMVASLLTLPCAAATRTAGSSVCDQQLTRNVPARADGALTGSQFLDRARDVTGPQRDALVLNELADGNVPSFLRQLVPVTLRSGGSADAAISVTVCVMPDYLAVGNDRDFAYVPMGLEGALDVANLYGFVLPTRKLVDAIYRESTVRLEPQPLPAGPEMRSTAYLAHHDQMVAAQRAARGAALGELTAGGKKDLVLTPRLWQVPGRVAIYGWHRDEHSPIQPLSTVHGARYADYSHGIRLVASIVFVNGVAKSMAEALADPRLASLLSDEGPLPNVTERLQSLLASLKALA